MFQQISQISSELQYNRLYLWKIINFYTNALVVERQIQKYLL